MIALSLPEMERLGYRDKHLRDPAAQRPAYDALLDSDSRRGADMVGRPFILVASNSHSLKSENMIRKQFEEWASNISPVF